MTRDALAGAVVGGRFIHPFVIGGLRVAPLTGDHSDAPLGFDRAEAEEYVAVTGGLADGAQASGRQIVGSGRVTLTGVATPTATPPLRGRPAWIGIVLGRPDAGGYNCPLEEATTPRAPGRPPSGSGATAYHPIDSAVIFYGVRGQGAVLYRTGGSKPCGGSTGPKTTVAYAQVSVPWVELGPPGLVTSVGYRAPACAEIVRRGDRRQRPHRSLRRERDAGGAVRPERLWSYEAVHDDRDRLSGRRRPRRAVPSESRGPPARSDSGVDTAVPRGSDRRVTDHTQHGGGVPDAANPSRRYRVPWRSLGSRWSAS